jgi:predicted phage terminase large subunit-like protein
MTALAPAPARPRRRITVQLPTLHAGQQAVEDSTARFKVIAAGRRWGKTRRSALRVIRGALEDPGAYFWVAPNFSLTLVGWEEMLWLADQIPGAEIRRGERKIVLPGGGWVQAKSAHNINGLRSRGLKGVVLEECAFMVEDAWRLAIRPALADKRGWAEFISTPNGHNWFYELAERAKVTERWDFFHAPTSSNPFISPDELDEMREELGPFAYAQEVDADFAAEGTHSFSPQHFRYFTIEPDGFVLRLGDGSKRFVPADEPWEVQTYDLAFSESISADFFVCVTMLVCRDGTRLILDVYRDHVAWSNQPVSIEERYLNAPALLREKQPDATLRPSLVGVEKEFHQMSVIQALRQRSGIPVRPMSTLGKQKPVRALRPAQLYQNEKIFHLEGAPWVPVFERELWDFPLGRHDDQVDALSYACELSDSSAAGLLEWYRRKNESKET